MRKGSLIKAASEHISNPNSRVGSARSPLPQGQATGRRTHRRKREDPEENAPSARLWLENPETEVSAKILCFKYSSLSFGVQYFRQKVENESSSMLGDHTLSRPGGSGRQNRLVLFGRIIPSVEIPDVWSRLMDCFSRTAIKITRRSLPTRSASPLNASF